MVPVRARWLRTNDSDGAAPPLIARLCAWLSIEFFVTVAPTPWLDGKHVVFGQVSDGFDTLGKIEAVGSKPGTPSASVVIEECGEL